MNIKTIHQKFLHLKIIMLPSKLKHLIEEYCMGIQPTDAQIDEIMDLAISLSADSSEVAQYMEEMQQGPTKEDREAIAKAEAERKAKEAAEKKAKREAAKKAQEEQERKEREAAARRAQEELQQKQKKQQKIRRRLLVEFIITLVFCVVCSIVNDFSFIGFIASVILISLCILIVEFLFWAQRRLGN